MSAVLTEMKPRILETSTKIRRPIDEVFAFFSKAENLDALTPSSLNFRIITPLPIRMQRGSIIDYRLKLNGIPFRWKTEISEWEPPHFFTDRQLSGPYVLWRHRHQFTALPNGHTLMTDRVEYLAPGWILEPLIHRFFVRKKVEQIFRFRSEKLAVLFDEEITRE